MIQKKIKTKNGFTLVEMMVSITIFLMIVVSGIGALISMQRVYTKSKTEQTNSDSLAYVFDIISRSIRTGYSYKLEPSVLGNEQCNLGSLVGAQGFSFNDQDGKNIKFTIEDTSAGKKIIMIKNNTKTFTLSHPENIPIDSMCFFVSGITTGDLTQPVVTVSIKTKEDSLRKVPPLYLQTTLTQRLLDR